MAGQDKNGHQEQDSIKEMLERLRRSVTDLPLEDPIPESAASIEEAPLDMTESTEDHVYGENAVSDQIEEIDDTLDEVDVAAQPDEMVLLPWEEDEPLAEDEEATLQEDDELDYTACEITSSSLSEVPDSIGVQNEELDEADQIDDDVIAAFFEETGAEEAIEVPAQEPENLSAVEEVPFLKAPDEEDAIFEDATDVILADDLPQDFLDITEDQISPFGEQDAKHTITDDEAALLFRYAGRPVETPAAPAAVEITPVAVEANEENGYAVEVEVRRPPAFSVPPLEKCPAYEGKVAVSQTLDLSGEVSAPSALHCPSDSGLGWQGNRARRNPVEVVETEAADEPPVADFAACLGKSKTIDTALAAGAPDDRAVPKKQKTEKHRPEPFRKGIQMSIDDIAVPPTEKKKAEKPSLMRLFTKKEKAVHTSHTAVTQTFDLQKDKALGDIQKKERRAAAREEGKRTEALFDSLYHEEAAEYHEYTSRNQVGLFRRKFESEALFLSIRVGILAFLSVMLLVFENGIQWGLPFERVFAHPISLVGLHLLLVFFGLLCSIPLFIRVWKQLFARRVISETFTALGLLLAVIYDALLCFALIPGSLVAVTVDLPSLRLFGLLPIAAALLSAAFELVSVKSDLAAFLSVSSAGDKLVCAVTTGGTTNAENAAITDLEEGERTRIVSIKKVSFVTGFFRRMNRQCEDTQKNLWLLPTAAVAALLVAIITAILGCAWTDAIYAFCIALTLALPLCILVLHKIPSCALFDFARRNACTVVGEVSAMEYSDTGAFAFEDVEAFPAKNVRVQRIKLYQDSALDHVMYQVSGLFSAVGGPLDGVFRSSTAELGLPSHVELLEAAEGGLVASVDGARICAGRGDYMLKKQVRMYYDPEDEQILASGKTSILYVAEEGQLIAKFYIRYRMSEVFEKNVERLAAKHIHVLLRTYDPNIREMLIDKISYTGRFGIRVVRKTVAQQMDYAVPQLNSGIVSRRSVSEVLRVLFACRRICRLTAMAEFVGLAVGCIGMLLGIVLATFDLLLSLSSGLLLAYHAAWFLPLMFASRFYIARKEK